jgi:hypothetical protein
VGKRADPFFKYLCLTLRNPNKIARITLNFEKFLLNEEGRPIRRYPRKYSGYDMEEDVKVRWRLSWLVLVLVSEWIGGWGGVGASIEKGGPPTNQTRNNHHQKTHNPTPEQQAVLAGQPLPPPSPKLIKAWRDAFVEAERSEYAFKKGCVVLCCVGLV